MACDYQFRFMMTDCCDISRVWNIYKALHDIFKTSVFVPRVLEKMARKIVKKTLLNSVDEGGRTLLMFACLDNKQDIVEFLLSNYGGEINIGKSDRMGNTALHYACLGARPSLISKLLREMTNKGVNIKKTNHEGLTAEDVAVRNDNAGAAKVFNKELDANRKGSIFVEYPRCRYSCVFPDLITTDKQFTKGDQALHYMQSQGAKLPPVQRVKSNELIQEEANDCPVLIPKTEPHKNSKAICSYLLSLRSMKDTISFRQGFPLIKSKGENAASRAGSSTSRCRTPISSASQVGVESRRGSSHRGSVAKIMKPGSVCSSHKTFRASRKFNSINTSTERK